MSEEVGTPAEARSPVLGDVEVPRADDVAPVTFVGGTGRSGTHVLAQLALAPRAASALVPVEVRFHTDPDGFPGLLAGEVTPAQFVEAPARASGGAAFRRSRLRGMYRFVDRERFDAAVERFEATYEADVEAACRRLFFDLLRFAPSARGRGIDRAEPDNVAQAATLHRLFPEARFIHVVRDGRDASASRVAQTRGLDPPAHPRAGDRVVGVSGSRRSKRAPPRLPPARLLTMSLDELLRCSAPAPRCGRCSASCGVTPTKRTRRYFRNRMTSEEANTERWREGVSAAKAAAHRGALRARRSSELEAAAHAARRFLPLRIRAPRRGGRAARLRLRSGDDDERRTAAKLVFVGGTGRSGTHILSYLLDRHSRFHGVPIECRFHCNPKGSPTSSAAAPRPRTSCASCAATGGTASGSATAPT